MMIEIIKELCSIPSAPGAEGVLLSYIEKEYGKYCDGVQYDGMGNLILSKKCGTDGAKKIMLAQSCTGTGCIVNYIEENGYLRVTKLGNMRTASAVYSQVQVGKGVRGVVVPEKDAEIKDGDFGKLYVDIGAKTGKEAEEYVSLGDVCTFVPYFSELCGTRVCVSNGPSVLGIAVLLEVLKNIEKPSCDLFFAFCVQDAPRNQGARASAFTVSPDEFILVDVCESYDTIGAKKRGEAVLGDGAVIIAKSADHCANPGMREKLEDICEKKNIRSKTCVYSDTTFASANIAKSGKGSAGVCVCVPVRNTDSGTQVADIADVQRVSELVSEYIEYK